MDTSSESDDQRRVIIACGGTGGHLFPGIAVAEALRRRGHEALLLISEKEIDALASEGHCDLQFRRMPAIGLGKLCSFRTVQFFFNFWKGYRQCRRTIREFGANAVLGMGGFTSTAPIVAGKRGGCATFIHESNSIPGKANRLTARFCDTVLLGLEDCARFFPGRDTRVVGTPVRTALRQTVNRAEALRRMELEEGRKTILVMGGSQGARGVNRIFCEALRELDSQSLPLQVIHITGPSDYEEVRTAYRELAMPVNLLPFLHDMHLAYTVADLAISRAGASSLAELAMFGVPSIMIPYPYAAEDHQTRNAEVFSKRHAAILLEESGLTGPGLADLIRDLMANPDKLNALSRNAAGLAAGDAAEKICEIIEHG